MTDTIRTADDAVNTTALGEETHGIAKAFRRSVLTRTAIGLCLFGLAGCSTVSDAYDDVAGFFDDEEPTTVASAPASTGATTDASRGFPTLGSVPDRPVATNEERRAALEQGLSTPSPDGQYSDEDLRGGVADDALQTGQPRSIPAPGAPAPTVSAGALPPPPPPPGINQSSQPVPAPAPVGQPVPTQTAQASSQSFPAPLFGGSTAPPPAPVEPFQPPVAAQQPSPAPNFDTPQPLFGQSSTPAAPAGVAGAPPVQPYIPPSPVVNAPIQTAQTPYIPPSPPTVAPGTFPQQTTIATPRIRRGPAPAAMAGLPTAGVPGQPFRATAGFGSPFPQTPLLPTSFGGGSPLGEIIFNYGSAGLDREDRGVIKEIAQYARQTGGAITVVGHASTRSGARTARAREIGNFRISLSRARAVAAQLIREGVPAQAVQVTAVSDSQPRYQESAPNGWIGNQRVVIYQGR